MLRVSAITVAVVSLALLVWLLISDGVHFGRPHDTAVAVVVFTLCLAQIPALWLRRWGWSLGALAMAFALITLDATVLDPRPDCSKGCTIVLLPAT